MVDKIAEFLGVALGPHVWLPGLFLAIIFNSGLTEQELKIVFPIILLLQVVIPLFYLILAPKLNWVEKWDMEDKEERRPIFLLIITLTLISSGVIFFYGNQVLLQLNIIILTLILILFIITYFWKISLHISMNTAGVILLNYLYHWHWWWFFITIPLIFWARLRLKKHTSAQLFAGLIISAAVTLVGLETLRI